MSTETYLDCALTPLEPGVNLVEASAGTGKTYAIAMLVLRAVTEQAIPLERILVVTFTKAATEELRSRIRQRLVEGRDLLDGGRYGDPTITRWAESIKDKKTAQQLLQQALYDIDRAAIFTIHSYCQRMLTEHAMESGQLFDVELLQDIEQIRNEVVEDYWRRRIYTLQPLVCGIVVEKLPTPADLYASVARAGSAYAHLYPDDVNIDVIVEELTNCFIKLATWWTDSSPELYRYYCKTLDEGKFKKGFIGEFFSWWSGLEDYFLDNATKLPMNLHYLSREGLKEALNGHKVKKKQQDVFLAGWPLPDELVLRFTAIIDQLIVGIRRDLLKHIQDELASRLSEQSQMSFDDLIRSLDHGLKNNGEGLQDVLRARYDMALIDEFQDTDSAQWRIFSTLFATGTHFLYLIGDPKQAIYRFRGADIYSYFTAKERSDRRLTLPKNYRSHPHLVQEVNRIFQGRMNPFAFDGGLMPFSPVEAAKTERDGGLYQREEAVGGMEFCQLSKYPKDKNGRWSSGRASEVFRKYVLHETCRILNANNPVVLRKSLDGQVFDTALQPRDIAVLVRSNRQADEYLQAFTQAGIPAIVGSKKSIFATDEALELLVLMKALVAPGDVYALKSCMAISWFGHSGDELLDIWQDERQFDGWFNSFQNYYQLWQERGFLSMLLRLLRDEDVYLHLAEVPMAERRIANIHHLLELVQEAETSEKYGPGQTLLWLSSMIGGKPGVEDRELRLESDEQAVRIVTMHGAKGLQYPVVFCPFLWYRSGGQGQEKDVVSCHDDNNELVVDLGSPQFSAMCKRAEAEELAEDLRLLYVALTRAEYRCYTMWVDVKKMGKISSSFDSALGYLLFPDGAENIEKQTERLASISHNPSVEHRVIGFEEELFADYSPKINDMSELVPRIKGTRSLHTDYQMSSYSAMASLSEHEDHGTDSTIDVEQMVESQEILHPGLPAGANFGNFIHDALERVSFSSLGARNDHSQEIGKLATRYGIELDYESIRYLLKTVVNTRLMEGERAFSLAELDEKNILSEMPFYFHMDRLETSGINDILRDDPAVTPLSHKVMQGYLTGFVDLFCEHEGRFYIIDYKTNFLGETLAHYRGARLVNAMASHNYGLQYWIYTLVLHRHLQNVLYDYSYNEHFGGVMYLFVRGMDPSMPGSGVYATLPDVDKLMRLDKLIGGCV